MKQITADLNKFLRYARPGSKEPMWVDLLDRSKVQKCLDMLTTSGACGLSGQLTKLNRFTHGLRYIRLRVAGNEDASLAQRCNVMEERLRQWRATIRPTRALQQKLATEEDVSSLEEARAFVTSKEIWEDVSDVMAKAAIGHPRKSERKLALAAVVTKLAYLTWQRLGAIVNANMDEYESLTRDIDEETGENCWVMLVA